MRQALTKWKTFPESAIPRVSRRLARIRNVPPPDVPRLLAYGWAGRLLRWEVERVQGAPLIHWLKGKTPPNRARLAARLSEQGSRWISAGFVHGDLSPRNILVRESSDRLRIWFIDWIADLGSPEGTPRYMSRNALAGRRDAAADRYALERIASEILRPVPNACAIVGLPT